MNWKHIEAMLKGSGRFQWAVVDGQHLVTNGHFAVVRGEVTIPEKGEACAPLEKLWRNYYVTKLGAAEVGGLVLVGEAQYLRKVGPEWIEEAYFRCFPGAKWFVGPKHCLLAAVDGVTVVALVMPLKQEDEERPIIPEGISDAQVFARFSAEENGWYLLSEDKLASEIGDLLFSISDKEYKITDLENEIDSARREIESLERLQRERFPPVELSPSNEAAPLTEAKTKT
jgi:hypothetical protein